MSMVESLHTKIIVRLFFIIISIDQAYVFGVSLTHSQNPRKHIWIFAGAVDETLNNPTFKCPCINQNLSPSSMHIPSFIENDYFCDTTLPPTTVIMVELFIQAILSGMDKDVAQIMSAALFPTCATTVHCGSSSIYRCRLLIT